MVEMDVQNLSSNWKKLQTTFGRKASSEPHKDKKHETATTQGRKRKFLTANPSLDVKGARHTPYQGRKRARIMGNFTPKPGARSEATGRIADSGLEHKGMSSSTNGHVARDQINAGLSPEIEIGRYVSIDCEMVGVGPHPDLRSALARVSIVNYNNEQVYDSYVKPVETVTDWRTHVSGIKPQHMIDARSFEEVQKDVAQILKDRVVIGHSLRNDFNALLLSHPRRDLRDTARHPPYKKLAGGSSPRLKILAAELLGLDIQNGEHSSLEDARACMLLFRKDKGAFEREHQKEYPVRQTPLPSNPEQGSTISTLNPNLNKKHKKKKKK